MFTNTTNVEQTFDSTKHPNNMDGYVFCLCAKELAKVLKKKRPFINPLENESRF